MNDTEPCTDPSECYWMEGYRYEGEVCDHCGAVADGKGGLHPPDLPPGEEEIK